MKASQHKPRPTTLPWRAMPRIVARMTAGAEAHGDADDRPGWLGVPDRELRDALARHLIAYMSGEDDEDHLAAIVCNGMMLMDKEEGR